MKLLNCLECGDVVALHYESRNCLCGASSGKYREDGLWAEYSGPSRVIGMLNSEMRISKITPTIPYKTNYKWFPINEGDHVQKTD